MTKHNLNKALRKIQAKNLTSWLNEAAHIHHDISEALNNIYFERDGYAKKSLGGKLKGLHLSFGWHTVDNEPKVFYAYVND